MKLSLFIGIMFLASTTIADKNIETEIKNKDRQIQGNFILDQKNIIVEKQLQKSNSNTKNDKILNGNKNFNGYDNYNYGR